ncbi:hypothetical protein ABKN59_001277 [Abortiporus biennis]
MILDSKKPLVDLTQPEANQSTTSYGTSSTTGLSSVTSSQPSENPFFSPSDDAGILGSTGLLGSSPISTEPPPSFEASAADKVLAGFPDVFVPPGGEEPPPEFTPYNAEYFVNGSGNIVSHDKHLNEDGEALYRFILSHSQTSYPKYVIDISGSHSEQRFRTVSYKDNQGHLRTRTESYTETIIDFAFKIDLTQHLHGGPIIHWSLPDEEPAYRGKMYKEVDGFFAESHHPTNGGTDVESGLGSGAIRLGGGNSVEVRKRRKATKKELKCAKDWEKDRVQRGYPPWVSPTVMGSQLDGTSGVTRDVVKNGVLRSSKTLREWADEYCASEKRFKEFTYEKVVYGWNIAALEAAITAAVKSTYYEGDPTVEFKISHNKIHVRPDSRVARMLSITWVKVILWILFIYPFIWLYKRFARRGGGRWEVCGGAYPLKAWQFSGPSSTAGMSIAQDIYSNATLIGMREGEWFQKWEGTIKRAVTGRLRTGETLVEPDEFQPNTAALLLDGYHP